MNLDLIVSADFKDYRMPKKDNLYPSIFLRCHWYILKVCVRVCVYACVICPVIVMAYKRKLFSKLENWKFAGLYLPSKHLHFASARAALISTDLGHDSKGHVFYFLNLTNSSYLFLDSDFINPTGSNSPEFYESALSEKSGHVLQAKPLFCPQRLLPGLHSWTLIWGMDYPSAFTDRHSTKSRGISGSWVRQ